MDVLTPEIGKRIVNHLKRGTTPLDCVHLLNVGNERWYEAATEFFSDIEADYDAMVRLVNGYYGEGKTHFLGMLRSIAFDRCWAVSYVTAENTPLNRFDLVYSQTLKNLTLPQTFQLPSWLVYENPRGGHALLLALFYAVLREAHRPGTKEGLSKQRVLEAVRSKMGTFTTSPQIDEDLASAISTFTEACLREAYDEMHSIVAWLEGGAAKPAGTGIKRRVDRKNAKDIMRGVSITARRAGLRGILVLLDEAERIMEQSKKVRNQSYGVLRDLLDNADGQGGMQSSILYLAATPEMFTDERGFAEYDALRSRLANTQRFAVAGFVDWRGVIVDLTQTPLPSDALTRLARRVRDIHGVAREWPAKESVPDHTLQLLVDQIDKGAFAVSKPRMIASSVASLLELAEQNRGQDVSTALENVLTHTRNTLAASPDVEKWD